MFLQKIFWWAVLIFTLFVVSVFKAPEIADSIGNTFGFPNLTEKIREFKSWFDGVVTHIPSQQEIQNALAETKSWAIKLKDGFIDWVEITKDKIDTVRETLSWAEQKIEDAKDAYNKTIDFIDETGNKINEVKQTIEDTSKVIEDVQNLWN